MHLQSSLLHNSGNIFQTAFTVQVSSNFLILFLSAIHIVPQILVFSASNTESSAYFNLLFTLPLFPSVLSKASTMIESKYTLNNSALSHASMDFFNIRCSIFVNCNIRITLDGSVKCRYFSHFS